MSLFDDVKARGIPYSSHESDLYLPATLEVRELLRKHRKDGKGFINQKDGKMWLDIPFSYDPWWIERGMNKP